MTITSIKEFFFSPTGSTENVVELASSVWELPKNKKDLTQNDNDFSSITVGDQELAIFGVPSYGGRVPKIAADRIAGIKGNHTPAILIVTYGNREYEDTLLELKNLVQANGFIVTAALAVVTEHSIVHEIAAGRPDAEDRKQLLEYARQIAGKLQEMENPHEIAVPGHFPYREYGVIPLCPKADKKCTVCGKCALLCPVAAIPRENPRLTDKEQCISCMRCIKVCPVGDRQVNAVMLKGASLKLKKACAVRKENEFFKL